MARLFAGRLGRLALVPIAIGLIAIAVWTWLLGWHPSTTDFPIQGVDVSQRQGAIDWNTLQARGADFAYIRATVGAGERDQRFAANWQGAGAAGMRRGAIHLWSFCRPAVDQADNFITTVPRTAGALPAVLEIDFTPDCDARPDRAAVIAGITQFLKMAETHTGKPMLLKISKAVARVYHPSHAIARPVWSARNFFEPDYAARPWRIWQATDLRRVDGVSGPINWDVVARQ